jgi:hypothetical protein
LTQSHVLILLVNADRNNVGWRGRYSGLMPSLVMS